jgi:hypothetical protein
MAGLLAEEVEQRDHVIAHQFGMSEFRTSFSGVIVENICNEDTSRIASHKVWLVFCGYISSEGFFSFFALSFAAASADLDVSVDDDPYAFSGRAFAFAEVDVDALGSTRHNSLIFSIFANVV